MFEIKKILTACINFPGIIILFLLITGFYGFMKKSRILKYNLICGIILYCLSVSYFTNNLIGFIEQERIYKGTPAVDAMILLGGGTVDGVPDISGKSIPSTDMVVRLVDAARLYKKYKYPIVVSGGTIQGRDKETVIVERFLADLGVKRKDIILEDSSRDTVENALNVKEIFRKNGFKKGLIITSAYHLRRAEFIFRKTGIEVYPHSSGILSDRNIKLSLFDFLPNTNELDKTAVTLKETFGLLFYYIKYAIF
ncbi:MAG: YdcF family protein [Spirochaetota bacterium]